MKAARLGAVFACGLLLSGCSFGSSDVDEELSLPDAKARAQTVEREIANALPSDLLISSEQNETGSFLACARGGGEQWAGGLTARVQTGSSAAQLLDPIEREFEGVEDLSMQRWERSGDHIIEIVGAHQSSWIVRYDPEREEVHVSSFSPCIHLPDGVWRGGLY